MNATIQPFGEQALKDLWMEMYIRPQYGTFARYSHINKNVIEFIKEIAKRYPPKKK